MGNNLASTDSSNLPDLHQSIITAPLITNDNSLNRFNNNSIKCVKVNLKDKTIPIYVYPKSITLKLINKSLFISFKYKSIDSGDMSVYLGVKGTKNKLPSLNMPICNFKIRENSLEVLNQMIEIDIKNYNLLFYNKDENYIPIAITLGKDSPCFFINCGFLSQNSGSELLRTNVTSYIVVDSILYDIREIYGMGGDSDDTCCICFSKPRNIIISPCNHRCICKDCSKGLIARKPACPVCRREVDGFIEVEDPKQ